MKECLKARNERYITEMAAYLPGSRIAWFLAIRADLSILEVAKIAQAAVGTTIVPDRLDTR